MGVSGTVEFQDKLEPWMAVEHRRGKARPGEGRSLAGPSRSGRCRYHCFFLWFFVSLLLPITKLPAWDPRCPRH